MQYHTGHVLRPAVSCQAGPRRLLIAAVLTYGALAAMMPVVDAHAAKPVARPPVIRKTGNLSITSYRPSFLEGKQVDPLDPMLRDFEPLRLLGFTSVEDYPTLDVLEPVKGRLHAEPYAANAQACQGMGIGYAIYPWVHFYPDWVEKEPGFTAYANLESGLKCRQPSGWAPATMKLVAHFYTVLGRSLGRQVSAVYVTDCSEYGELGYPNGYTQWLRTDPNAKKGWWCGDRYARADFQARMLKQYGPLDKLNGRWGTSFPNAREIAYPPIDLLKENPDPLKLKPADRRWVLDFIYWYQDSAARRMQSFLRSAQAAFPNRPCEIKLGHGDESAMMGHSYSSACRILNGTPRLAIRSTHAATSYFHVKRVSTPARFFGFKDFLTEPPGTMKPERMAERIFTDACAGVTAYFDYPQNPRAAGGSFTDNIRLLDGTAAIVDVALLFPEADHYLRINQAYPRNLLECAGALRDVADFDVIDERLVAAGVLKRYAVVVLVGTPILEEETCSRLTTSIDSRALRLVQIVPAEDWEPAGRFVSVDGREWNVKQDTEASGAVRRLAGKPDGDAVVTAVAEVYAEVLRKRGLDDRSVEILTARDGVLAGLFDRRILAYNTAEADRKVGGATLGGRKIMEIKRSR